MEQRIIKEYKLFEGGSSYLELYDGANQVDNFYPQFYRELDEIGDLEEKLKDLGVSHFRLCFDLNKMEVKKDVEHKGNGRGL